MLLIAEAGTRNEGAQRLRQSCLNAGLRRISGPRRRSVLAEAIFAQLLECSEERLHVEIESASVGPAYEGGHDPRVLQVGAA